MVCSRLEAPVPSAYDAEKIDANSPGRFRASLAKMRMVSNRSGWGAGMLLQFTSSVLRVERVLFSASKYIINMGGHACLS